MTYLKDLVNEMNQKGKIFVCVVLSSEHNVAADTAGISLCQAVDPDFTSSHIYFDFPTFLETLTGGKTEIPIWSTLYFEDDAFGLNKLGKWGSGTTILELTQKQFDLSYNLVFKVHGNWGSISQDLRRLTTHIFQIMHGKIVLWRTNVFIGGIQQSKIVHEWEYDNPTPKYSEIDKIMLNASYGAMWSGKSK